MNTTSAIARDEAVIMALESASAMLHNIAYVYDLEYDDLYQNCAEAMIKAWGRIPQDCKTKVGYLYCTARNEARRIIKRHEREDLHPVSLDAPRTEDEASLTDTLVDIPVMQDMTRVDEIIETVHTVLNEMCTIEEQEYVIRVHGINALTPVAPTKPRPCVKSNHRSAGHMLGSIKRIFRKHPQVLGLIQQEPCVL